MLNSLLRMALALLLAMMATIALADDDFFPPEQAFKFSASMADSKTVAVNFEIADGYYMYRERFAFKAEGAKLGEPVYPKGKVKFDETFQKNVETYRHQVTVKIPVDASGNFKLVVTSQGCADKGLCYAPMESNAQLSAGGKGGLLDAINAARGPLNNAAPGMETPQASISTASSTATTTSVATPASTSPDAEMSTLEAALKSGKLMSIVPLFLLGGLVLAFTPCVLPMVPILSFLIVGEGSHVSRKRSLLLSGVYSLGMALVYTALGVAAGLAGEGLSASLQQPMVLTVFALLMVVLSLAMFDVYQLQMPAAVQLKLTAMSQKQRAGKLLGVFVMGALSALIVGPCVAAPLAGALLYISQTRDVVVGGSALFAMAMGMSIPLILVGMSAGTLLPRAGRWMEEVKYFFGVLMLGMALWIVSPLLQPWMRMTGWMLLAGGYGAYLIGSKRTAWAGKSVGVLFILLGLLEFTGLATGAQDPLAPLAKVTGSTVKSAEFHRIKTLADLENAVRKAQGKTVMLDFYADWCVSCKEMEKFTFTDPSVQKQMQAMVLLQADVTANTPDDKALLKRFNLFGPPGMIFFNRQGQEIGGFRVIGFQNAEKFATSLQHAAKF